LFLLLASAITAATVASFQLDFQFSWLRVPAAALLSLLSVAFWRLDRRNRHLIKAAEAALRWIEMDGKPDDWTCELRPDFLFVRDHREAVRRKGRRMSRQESWSHTCSEVFELLFAAFFLVGLLLVGAMIMWR